ncbi:MAG: dTDP-4-dehydrorhamnose 3,5-epimerase [bacterium]|nr:dTDP-4-dehydrorhamnose 3,5-epimerase [bacterium]
MTFDPIDIDGAFLIDIRRIGDDRGSFARLWCREVLEGQGLVADFVQCNASWTAERGTIRGLHYQVAPYDEVKVMHCVRGSIFDVMVDVRPGSPTYGRWTGVELSAETPRMLYVPAGVAHGFQTLEDDTHVIYPVSAEYHPESERGIRWNDPAFGIDWPIREVKNLSDKDRDWPDCELAPVP